MRHTIYLKNDAQLLVVRVALRDYWTNKVRAAQRNKDADKADKFNRVLRFVDETIQVVDGVR